MTRWKTLPGRRLFEIALGLTVVFVLVHLAGFREHTSVLAGVHAGESWMLFAGVVYLLAYVLVMSVVPILTLAGGLLVLEGVWRRSD